MMHSHHRPHFVHPVSAGVDDHVTVDIALFGVNFPGIVFALLQTCHLRMAIYLGPSLSGMKGKRLTKLCWVDISVLAVP